jgi:very-short-patch-repair endonuclease
MTQIEDTPSLPVLSDLFWERLSTDEKGQWVEHLKRQGAAARNNMGSARDTLLRALGAAKLGAAVYPLDRISSRYLADFHVRKAGLVIDVAPKEGAGHIVVFLRRHGYVYLMLSEQAIEDDLAGCVERVRRITKRRLAERGH